MSALPMRKQVERYIRELQESIVTTLEKLDPNAPPFKRDAHLRGENGVGGYGQSCVFAVPTTDEGEGAQSTMLEKGGVNITITQGTLPPRAVEQMRADHQSLPVDVSGGLPFFAGGLSLVLHPRNPHAPTVHANYRYFEITSGDKVVTWWFGGGADLTPSILYDEDVVHFHQTHKEGCEKHGPGLFPALKKWCDEYFTIPHRGEARGVGGIFFDDLAEEKHARIPDERPKSAEGLFRLMQTLGNAFIPAYVPILTKRHSIAYTPRQRRWQLVRRGRYVEFNLIYDRGTKFGLLAPNARVESILMSLPEVARWEYQCPLGEDDPESEEGRLLAVVRSPKEWV